MIKKIILLCMVFCLSFSIVNAVDLSDYPDMFEGEEVYLVVGKDGTSTDVLMMTKVQMILMGKATIKNALDTELESLEHNIISIGDPCKNKVSYELLGGSADCEIYNKEGEGSIELFSNHGMYQIVVMAGSDAGIREIADALVNYADYDLSSESFSVTYDEPEVLEQEEETQEDFSEDDSEEEQEEESTEKEEEDVNDGAEPEERIEEVKEETVSDQEIPQKEDTGSKNIFVSFINWVINLFS